MAHWIQVSHISFRILHEVLLNTRGLCTTTMPPRGAGRAWAPLPIEPVASMSQARAEMKSMDQGSKCLWKRPLSGMGDGVRVAVLECNAHVGCGFRLGTVRRSDGTYSFETSGEHGTKVNEKMRQNSPMTHAQVAFANASFTGTGSTPAEVMVGLTKVKEAELQVVGIDPLSKKNAESGMAGASCPPFLTYCVCIQHVSRQALTYCCVFYLRTVCIMYVSRQALVVRYCNVLLQRIVYVFGTYPDRCSQYGIA